MMGWLIALLVILLIMCLPVGISARFDSGDATANLILGPIRIRIYPKAGDGKAGEVHKKKKSDQPPQKQRGGRDRQGKGGNYRAFLPVVRIVLDFLEAFRQKLRVNRLELKLTLAASDPYDLAINYGRAWATLGNLMPQLERFFVIRKRDLAVECDFAAAQTIVFARVDLTITVGRILRIGVWHGFRVLYHYYKIANQRKGGARI